MTDIVDRLRKEAFRDDDVLIETMSVVSEAADEIERMRAFIGWVDSWVSNPVGSYSIYALDGLFRMTRDKLAVLSHPLAPGEASEVVTDRDNSDAKTVVR